MWLLVVFLQMSKRTKIVSSGPSRSVWRFISNEHEERFEKLIKRTIRSERFIRLSPGGNYRKLVANIEKRKWGKFCDRKRKSTMTLGVRFTPILFNWKKV